MKNEIFIKPGERLALEQYISIASRTMALIAEAAEGVAEIDKTFSVTDFSDPLNKICVPIVGEFEMRQAPSNYYRIVYVPDSSNEAALDEAHLLSNFLKTHDVSESCLWVNKKVLFAFTDRKLHGFAAALYFYLGHLMTRDETFAISRNISFEKILENWDTFPEGFCVKHRTTVMRALADLQDAGLIKWNTRSGTFELLHITPYDPNEKV